MSATLVRGSRVREIVLRVQHPDYNVRVVKGVKVEFRGKEAHIVIRPLRRYATLHRQEHERRSSFEARAIIAALQRLQELRRRPAPDTEGDTTDEETTECF